MLGRLEIEADVVAWSYGMWLDHPATMPSDEGWGMVGSVAAGAPCDHRKPRVRRTVCEPSSGSWSVCMHMAGLLIQAVVRSGW